MKKFLENLYYGDVDPQARIIKHGSEPEKLLSSISQAEEELTKGLTEEQKKVFNSFSSSLHDFATISALDAFITGFRMGAGFAMDTFVSDDAPFGDLE